MPTVAAPVAPRPGPGRGHGRGHGHTEDVAVDLAHGHEVPGRVVAHVVHHQGRHHHHRRIGQQQHGLAEEPSSIFAGRNALIAAGFIAFSYLLASYKGLPNVLIVMFALIVLYGFVTTSTTIGRRVYAMGGNEKAAKLSGITSLSELTIHTFTWVSAK